MTKILVLMLPLSTIGAAPAVPVMVIDLLMVSGDRSTIWPEVLNLMVSLLAAPLMAARREPAPLSLLLMTDQTAISRRGSSGSMRARRDDDGEDDDE